jgi:YD repeat-containing protein
MKANFMNILLTVVLMTLSLAATAEQPDTYTWSSTTCAKCQSTIVYQAWFPDKSPLVAEGMPGMHAGALVALSLIKDTMVVSLGLSIAHDPPLTLDPRQSVTIETDSSPHMVLYALLAPGPGFHKDDVVVMRQLNSRSLPLRPDVPASGFLFFPFDRKATRFVVVVKVGGETFRFPFAQDPRAQAKFDDPAKLGSSLTEPSRVCSRNVSFVVSNDGKLEAEAPGFAGKWLEKNGAQYPGVCFSQVPDPRIAHSLVAFAPSEAAFDEFSPSLRASPVRDAAGLGGEGSGNDSHRAVWTYHYAGTAASTTTTTTFIEQPFGNKTRTLYAFTWDQNGRLISRRQRAVATRRGDIEAFNLGEGVAAAIAGSHLKERLLDDAVHDLTR